MTTVMHPPASNPHKAEWKKAGLCKTCVERQDGKICAPCQKYQESLLEERDQLMLKSAETD